MDTLQDNFIHLYRMVYTTIEQHEASYGRIATHDGSTERLCGDKGNDGTARHYRNGKATYPSRYTVVCPDCEELAPIFLLNHTESCD